MVRLVVKQPQPKLPPEGVQVVLENDILRLSERPHWVEDAEKSAFITPVEKRLYSVYMSSGDEYIPANPGDWIVRDEYGLSVYSNKDFFDEFDMVRDGS
jgi:hypothetical protein